MIVSKVLDPVAESVSVIGFKSFEIEALYDLEP
jgi:hypothetical protein